MAWESGFFNSVNGDRLYNADKLNEIFEGLISNGVFANVGDKLVVSPNSGMTIQIGTGRGWFNNHWIRNTSEHLMVLEGSDVLLNRYAAVVVQVDESASVRDVKATIKYSDFATTPVKPTMTRSVGLNEYCLAYVYIKAGATSITASDIEDTRFNDELCGWVNTIVDHLSTSGLYEQWDDLFNSWFSTIQDIIDDNVETKLVNALPVSTTVTLSSSGWTASDDNYTQSVTVTNMNSTKSVIVQANEGSESNYSNYRVKCSAQATNELTFTAKTIPAEDITVKLIHMGV